MKKNAVFYILVILALLATFLPVSAFAAPVLTLEKAQSAATSGFFKVIAKPGVLDARQSGITLWHDYYAFALYKVEQTALASLSKETLMQVNVLQDANQIQVDAYPFDTQTDNLDRVPTSLRSKQSTGSALHLIQFVGPIKDSWLDMVQATGATPVHYIANYGYLVWADEVARTQLGNLASLGNVVQYSAPYQPYFKLGSSLNDRIAADRMDETIEVTIQIYDHRDKTTTQSLIADLAVVKPTPWTSILAYQNTVVTVLTSDLETIANQPDVFWIGERFERQLDDEIQDQILAANFNVDQSGPDAPGYLPFLAGYGFSTDPADYPIVDITDDGIGNGTVNSGDYSLHEFGVITNATRLSYVANCTSESSGEGLDGHGHINTSIVGGYDPNVGGGFPYEDSDGYLRGLGVSPFTRLAGTRIFDSAGYDVSSCSGTDTGVIKSVQDNGAYINTNSWGCSGCAGTYDASSQAYDVGVRDADLTEAGNQEMIILFSAGNSGPSSDTIGTPGNGKNMITVGASENDRPSDEDGDWTDGCAVGPTGADDAMDVIDFSSRGPAPGGRVKPEIIAPGTHIQGTASTNSSYNGSGVCDQYRPSGQTVFAASSGTSHSTPAVAGVASLYTYWLEQEYGLTPSPAMMKAYLIAHPTYLTGVDANDTLPSNDQGYGMPNLQLAFDDTGRYLLDQTQLFDNTGETWIYQGQVADPTKPVRVVLAYTDEAGAVGTSPEVNNLDLDVVVGGNTYLGNVFSGQWSTTGGSADADNNYEAVFLPVGTSGVIDITVTAFNIGGDGVPNTGDATDQDFAIVVYNIAPPGNLGWLDGTITDASTTDPIEDAEINATGTLTSNLGSTMSAVDGTYHMALVSDTFTVTASTYGYLPVEINGISVISGTTTTLDVALTAAPMYTLSGSVTDANTGWGLFASVEIVPDGHPAQTVWTDPWSGAYSVDIAGSYTHTLNVEPWSGIEGYIPQSREVFLNGNTTENFALDVNIDSCTAPGYSGTGISQGFEDATFPPEGWSVYNMDGLDPDWERVTSDAYSGTASAHHDYDLSDAQNGWLVSPRVTLDSTSPELSFWQKDDWTYGTFYVKHSVQITTDADPDPTTATYTELWSDDCTTSWAQQTIDLSAYAGQQVYIAYQYEGYDGDEWYIDDVLLTPFICDAPTTGGLLAGSVYDANDNAHLAGAEVTNSLGDVATAQATPGDNFISEAFYVIYAPAGTQTFTATLSGYEDTVVSGYAIADGLTQPQDFWMHAGYPQVDPGALHATVAEGLAVTLPLTVSNGNGNVGFEFEFQEHDEGFQPARFLAGGPDAYGYTYADSTEPDGPSYSWIDATDGTALGLVDDGEADITLPFMFDFYGTTSDLLTVGNNGAVVFGQHGGEVGFTNGNLTVSGTTGDAFIAPFWDDLDTETGDVYTKTIGTAPNRQFVIEWYNRPHWDGIGAATVEMILFEGSNDILFQYQDVDFGNATYDDGASASVGIRLDETSNLQYSYNTAMLTDNLAILFSYPAFDVPWVSEDPISGTLPASGETVIDITFDASVVTQVGDYYATLRLTNNSPYGDVSLPITMTVTQDPSTLSFTGLGGSGNIHAVLLLFGLVTSCAVVLCLRKYKELRS